MSSSALSASRRPAWSGGSGTVPGRHHYIVVWAYPGESWPLGPLLALASAHRMYVVNHDRAWLYHVLILALAPWSSPLTTAPQARRLHHEAA